ncbi:flagellar hook-associated protein FlgK [Erythrobacter sp. HL-111]|uniref:flagellar hook-associated protein FlgK n=1 Tax=Erythrobacter sp. HL-111 TaxID=1798193 RepID=UPI0006DA97BA|nr:flagellar basal body rod C-terminal domain-containing protein [Erythrobacter sp. HL-111]KPP92570.1 MAG: flagellar hook-associated protein 1 FlgK [Erythrobacteraceae bacterium HL-111]SDS92457.1 flagellar hook-associated protein 1 FlgK [Erythrobacter sp. HL-111]
MPTALINIGRTGAAAARASIELTAQNIANASNPDYARRTLGQNELVGSATIGVNSADSLGGVRLGEIRRIDSVLVQRQARESAADLARTSAELDGLRLAETALEESGLYPALVDYEAALVSLESDPLDPALRTVALETARQLTDTFRFADSALGNARRLVQAEVEAGVDNVRGLAEELARINRELAAAREGSAGQASLLDARDATLRQISDEFGIVTRFDEKGAVEVRLSAAPSPLLVVQEGRFNTLTADREADGSYRFRFGDLFFEPDTGAMAGREAALVEYGRKQGAIDRIAGAVIASGNAAQGAGTAPDGTAGQPLFSGTNARTIGIALASGAGLATAGAGAGSRDTAALEGLIAAIGAADGPVAETDEVLLTLSSRIAGLSTTREGLSIIAAAAEAELLTETGVDLDAEAANLVRLQQAFEANSRVIRVASEIFDTILGLA